MEWGAVIVVMEERRRRAGQLKDLIPWWFWLLSYSFQLGVCCGVCVCRVALEVTVSAEARIAKRGVESSDSDCSVACFWKDNN